MQAVCKGVIWLVLVGLIGGVNVGSVTIKNSEGLAVAAVVNQKTVTELQQQVEVDQARLK